MEVIEKEIWLKKEFIIEDGVETYQITYEEDRSPEWQIKEITDWENNIIIKEEDPLFKQLQEIVIKEGNDIMSNSDVEMYNHSIFIENKNNNQIQTSDLSGEENIKVLKNQNDENCCGDDDGSGLAKLI
jgi:hypothetical protein